MTNKKKVVALVAILIVAGLGYLAFRSMRSKTDISVNEQAPMDQQQSQLAEEPQKLVASADEVKEIVGTVMEVYETEDPNFLILVVEVDITAPVTISEDTLSNVEESVAVEVSSKQFDIVVGKNIPIQNGSYDELGEDDFVQIDVEEDINTATGPLTAINLEVVN